MVCPEYLDVINVVVRDAYYSTHPRAISAEGYLRSLAGHGSQMYRSLQGYGTSMSYDEAWRKRVMERAFARMVNRDKILTSEQTRWVLHPDFEAKRFFKIRHSAEWVSQIYSTEVAQQHQSRVALQSLENFLDCDLGPISGKQLIKFFGPAAGEEYDALQIQDKGVIKREPASESVDLNRTSSMATVRKERIEIDLVGDEEHNSSGSEASSPIPLFTPSSHPPSLQHAPSSSQINTDAQAGASSKVVENSREAAAAQSDMIIMEKAGQDTRVEAQLESATIEKARQESQRGTQPITTVETPRQEISLAAHPQRAAIETTGHQSFRFANLQTGATEKTDNQQSVMRAASAGSVPQPVTLDSLLSRYPWIPEAAKRTQERFPMDSFELVVSEGTLKFKCHDCPLNLYKAIYPYKNISNFEAHLRNASHRATVAARLGGVSAIVPQSSPASAKSFQSRVSVFPAQPSPSDRRERSNSQLGGGQASPASHKRGSMPRTNLRSSLAQQSSAEQDNDGDSDQHSPSEPRSLIVIFPVGRLLNGSNARKHGRVPEPSQTSELSKPSEPSEPGYEGSDNADRAKKRRLDPAGYSINPHTAKARARIAKLDPRTKQYESMIANDRKGAKNHVEHVVKRSEAYQRASPTERSALEERGRNEYMNARYELQSNRGKDLLTRGRRKMGRDAESYARAQGGYNKLTKLWGSAEGSPTGSANGTRSASYVDAVTDSRDLAMEEPQNPPDANVKAGFETAQNSDQMLQSSTTTSQGPQKYHSSDDKIESQIHARRDLESEMKASESSIFSNMVGEKRSSLSSLLSLLENRSETQRQNFTAAHQLQVSTSEEVGLLRSTSYRHDQELDAIKNSAKREKEWRKYFDKSTKEEKAKLARLEAKVTREREDKQNFKMSMEGRVDAILKHHQTSSDDTSKRLAALEKEAGQTPDAMSQRVAALENLMTDQNKQLHQTLSGSMFKKVAALEKQVTDQSRQNQQTVSDALAKRVATLEKSVADQSKHNQQISSDAMSKKVAALEKLITDQSRHHQNLSGAMSRKMDAMEKLVTDQSKQLVEQSKLIEMLTKRVLASSREFSQTPGMEPIAGKEKERAGLPTAGAKPSFRQAWAK